MDAIPTTASVIIVAGQPVIAKKVGQAQLTPTTESKALLWSGIRKACSQGLIINPVKSTFEKLLAEVLAPGCAVTPTLLHDMSVGNPTT